MAFVLVIAGLIMIVTGARGTYSQFGAQVASDFTGPGNFLYFVAAIGSIGALGYVPALRTFSRWFMALILLAIVLSNKGFAAKLTEALNTGPIAPQGGTGTPAANQALSTSTGSGADGSSLKSSLTKPGGGGFWSYIGIPSPFGAN